MRIKAPDPFEQALAAQDLVAAGDDAVEIVGDVEDRRVAIGDLGIEREQVGQDRASLDRRVDAHEQLDGAPHPHAPVAEQAALIRTVCGVPSTAPVNGVTRSRTM